MDVVDILLIAFIIFCIYMYFKLKNNPKLQEEYKNKLSSKNNKEEDVIIEDNYVDSMDVSISLKSEKNKLLHKLLKGEKVTVKFYHIVGIYKLTDDKVIGFAYDSHSNIPELRGVFEVKNNNGKFRAAEYDYDVSQFKEEKEIEIKAYYNPRTWDRVLIENINLKIKD